jgi:hypothetical protein
MEELGRKKISYRGTPLAPFIYSPGHAYPHRTKEEEDQL